MRRGNRMMEDLDQDIRDHIERETQDNIERGMAPEEARYVAVRRFGNVTRVKEETREVWSFVWLEQLWQEQALKACGANWTILRCNFFSQNFSENFFLDAIPAGEVALPVGPVAEPFVDAEDIADAAVAVLTLPGHAAKLYELTGPLANDVRRRDRRNRADDREGHSIASDRARRPSRHTVASADPRT
jgi:hypothetical protein